MRSSLDAELFRIYAAQLEESSIEIMERGSAGRQANVWYFHLLNPLMTAILGKSSYDPDKDPLVIAIEKIGQGAGTKRCLDSTFAEAEGKKTEPWFIRAGTNQHT
jgi:hypothetical protein